MTHVSRIVLAALTTTLAMTGTAFAVTPGATPTVPITKPGFLDPAPPKQSVTLDAQHLLQHLGANFTNVSLSGTAVDISSSAIGLMPSSKVMFATSATGVGAATLDKGTYKLSVYLETVVPLSLTMSQIGPNNATSGATIATCNVTPGAYVQGVGAGSTPCTFTLPLTPASQIAVVLTANQPCQLDRVMLNQY